MCKKKDKKKTKTKYVDDGHTVYNMDGVGGARHRDKEDSLGMNRKERRAAIRAALATYLPIFIGTLACFAVAALLMWLWLL